MWLLKWASQDIGNFNSIESAHKYLADKYGNENVTNKGEFTPMLSYKDGRRWKSRPNSLRGRCIEFDVKETSKEEGWTSTTNFVLEEIPVLD